jgi:hypothetical protein
MKRVRGNTLFCCIVLALAGCAHAPATPPPPAADQSAAEQARREERLKLMQEYWQEHTAADAENPSGPPAPPPLEYPAGTYSGINFAPRLAPDPSLAEPDR